MTFDASEPPDPVIMGLKRSDFLPTLPQNYKRTARPLVCLPCLTSLPCRHLQVTAEPSLPITVIGRSDFTR